MITREDYDAMAGQVAASMSADTPREDDIPDRPVFVNIGDDDEEEDLVEVVSSKKEMTSNRGSIVESTKSFDPHSSTPTYRPAYVPPTPAAPVENKPTIQIDTSKVKAGTIVKHKAFGLGQVKGIDGNYIIVTFSGIDRRFHFPGAFFQGFLSLDE